MLSSNQKYFSNCFQKDHNGKGLLATHQESNSIKTVNNSNQIHSENHLTNYFHKNNYSNDLQMNFASAKFNSSTLLDIQKGKPIRLQVKVLVPVHDHPNFNFIGKLLGPKGNSLKWLQEETQTKMAILGKGSMRDKKKEEELRQLGDQKYAHLNEDLHIEINAFAPPSDAYIRIGHALHQIKQFLVPDYYDEIRQQQLKELGILNDDKKPSFNNKCYSESSKDKMNRRVNEYQAVENHRCNEISLHHLMCPLDQSPIKSAKCSMSRHPSSLCTNEHTHEDHKCSYKMSLEDSMDSQKYEVWNPKSSFKMLHSVCRDTRPYIKRV